MSEHRLKIAEAGAGSLAVDAAPASVRVWDISVRVFHWALVTCVVIAWFSAGENANIHELAGYIVIALLLFRLWWGFVGTRYARFSSFFPTPRKLFGYLKDLLRGRSARHLGHNPAGAVMIFALMGILTVIGISGWAMLTRKYFGVVWVENVHKYAVYGLLALVPLHVAGALMSSVMHRENLIFAMFTGKKPLHRTGAGARNVVLSDPVELSVSEQLMDRIRAIEAFSVMTALTVAATAIWFVAVPPVDRQPTTDTALQQSAPTPSKSISKRDYIYGVPDKPSFTWMLASGGRLYDSWFAALRKEPPPGRHPAWPASNKNLSDADTWRCKNCHGWDYKGRFGQYGRGSNRTGIVGIRDRQGANPRGLMRLMRQPLHGFTRDMIPDDALYRIALFVSNGQHSTDRYIRRDGTVRGNIRKGKVIFQNLCAICHGFDGKARNLAKGKKSPAYVGTKAQANPWEVLHKIRNGFPGKQMVALRAFRMRDAVNVLSYAQTLPEH